MKFRRRKNLLKGLILSFATAAIVIPTAQARVSNYNTSAQQARTALNQTYSPEALKALTLRSEAMNQQYQASNQTYSPEALKALSLRSEAMNQLYQGSTRPDDRSGVRGVEPVQSVTDVNAMQQRVELEKIQHMVEADRIAAASASTRPDDKAGFRGPGTVESQSAELASVKGDGFNWQDASIGAGTAVGMALVLMSGLVLLKRRHSELAV
jgi:hypothetical protein